MLRVPTPDGATLAVHDLGGEGPTLLLAHATGFCGAIYTPLAAALGDRYHCLAIDHRGHGASTLPPDGDLRWPGFARDLLAVVDHLGLDRPPIFGHSLGGAVAFLAERARPDTFRAIYAYEPALALGFGRPASDGPGAGDDGPGAGGDGPVDNPMAAGARRRRAAFASRDEALAHFAARPLFARFHPDALAGYVRDGLVPDPDSDRPDDGAVVLACSPETEALTFTHATDHDVLEHLAEIGCPTTLAYGDLPDAFGPVLGGEVHRRMPQATLEIAHGLGHLGPCDDPTRVAGAVVAALAGS